MPLTLRCTDRDEFVEQTFLNGGLVVRTRSGLHPVEAALIRELPAQLPRFSNAQNILVCQTRTGATAAALRVLASGSAGVPPASDAPTRRREDAGAPSFSLTLHTYDAHHARSLRRNPLPNSKILCTPFLPDEIFDAAFLIATDNGMPNELLQDLLQNIRQHLAPHAPLFAAFDSPLETTRGFIAPLFGKPSIKVLDAKSDPPIHLAVAHCPAAPLARVRDFSATFSASLPGVPPFELTTWPGVFAHRRADEGGLALAETAATLLKPNERVLDIGCGSGFAGIALALAQPAPTRVTFLDAHARAVHAADFNARRHNLPGFATHLAPAGDFTPAAPDFTLALANPPYFSDYKIARDFIELALRSLAPGGRLLLVTRQTAFYKEFLPPLFKRVEPLRRRAYALFLCCR